LYGDEYTALLDSFAHEIQKNLKIMPYFILNICIKKNLESFYLSQLIFTRASILYNNADKYRVFKKKADIQN
jgi:hypothetical protein